MKRINLPLGLLKDTRNVGPIKLQRLENIGGEDRDIWYYRKTQVPKELSFHRRTGKVVGKTVFVRNPDTPQGKLQRITVGQLVENYAPETKISEVLNSLEHQEDVVPREWVKAKPDQVTAFKQAEQRLMGWVHQQEVLYRQHLIRTNNANLKAAYELLVLSERMYVRADGALCPKHETPTVAKGRLGWGIVQIIGCAYHFVTNVSIGDRTATVDLVANGMANALSFETEYEARSYVNKTLGKTDRVNCFSIRLLDTLEHAVPTNKKLRRRSIVLGLRPVHRKG